MVAALPRSGLAEVAVDMSSETPVAGGGWGKQGPVRRPSVQLTADGRSLNAGMMVAAASAPPGRHTQGLSVSGVVGRQDSGGLEYAPDSKAMMARINRWWKRLDEGYMQPRFGGPTRIGSSPNLQVEGAGQGNSMHMSTNSFSVPARMVG
jgi:hypothetical protein